MLGDVLDAIYFIRGGLMEIFSDNESQAILGRNDIFGDYPLNTITLSTRCRKNKIVELSTEHNFVTEKPK